MIQAGIFQVIPLSDVDQQAVLEVYRQCEDFLALGPQSKASMKMVQADMELSHDRGGLFCGIFNVNGTLLGVVDYLPSGFEGNAHHAFLELLMIGMPHRGHGLGGTIVAAVEAEIFHNPTIQAILLGVQVNNPDARRFWVRCGYVEIRGPTLMPDQTTACLMKKLRVTG
jgi:RimJ/RimL family protein N-acetyltransferase